MSEAPSKKADTFYAFVALQGQTGEENLVAAAVGNLAMPLCTVQERLLPRMRELAAKVAQHSRQRIRLVEYSAVRELEVFEPPAEEKAAPCPECGCTPAKHQLRAINTEGALVQASQAPGPGDLVVCPNCTAFLTIISQDGTLRLLTAEEIAELDASQRSLLVKARAYFKQNSPD